MKSIRGVLLIRMLMISETQIVLQLRCNIPKDLIPKSDAGGSEPGRLMQAGDRTRS